MTGSVRRGQPWGRAPTGPPAAEVEGGDADLARAVGARRGLRVRFRPRRSDLARAVGLPESAGHESVGAESAVPEAAGPESGAEANLELPIDGLALDCTPPLALNAVVLGTPPDRLARRSRRWPIEVVVDGRALFAGHATTVVVASGQYRNGVDLVPRGHPGDGRAEIQVYALRAGERRAMVRRLATGTHVPHPRIREVTGRRVQVRSRGRALPLEVDGRLAPAVASLQVEVVPAAAWVLL